MICTSQGIPMIGVRGAAREDLPRRGKQDSWWMVCLEPQMDYQFAKLMFDQKVNYVLPLARRPLVKNGKISETVKVVFPGYCFILGDERAFYVAQDTRRTRNFTKVADAARLEYELHDLCRALGGLSFSHVGRFEIGKRVRVAEGHPLAGLEGVVSGVRGDEIAISVQCLGTAIFHVHPEFLRLIQQTPEKTHV